MKAQYYANLVGGGCTIQGNVLIEESEVVRYFFTFQLSLMKIMPLWHLWLVTCDCDCDCDCVLRLATCDLWLGTCDLRLVSFIVWFNISNGDPTKNNKTLMYHLYHLCTHNEKKKICRIIGLLHSRKMLLIAHDHARLCDFLRESSVLLKITQPFTIIAH